MTVMQANDGSQSPVRPTDVVLYRELERQEEACGASTASTRQLAELTGMTHKTVSRSLGRLAAAGRIVKVRKARGSHPAHWKTQRALNREPMQRPVPSARMTPRDALTNGTADVFRRRDLSGPGALYAELPAAGSFTAPQVLSCTELTVNLRTVEWWLLVLASQYWPMVEEIAGAEPLQWRKLHLSGSQMSDNAGHLTARAEYLGRRSLKTRAESRRQHQFERLSKTMRSAVPSGH